MLSTENDCKAVEQEIRIFSKNDPLVYIRQGTYRSSSDSWGSLLGAKGVEGRGRRGEKGDGRDGELHVVFIFWLVGEKC